MSDGGENPLAGLLANDKRVTKLVSKNEVEKLVSVKTAKSHTGLASQKCSKILLKIKKS